MQGSFEETMLIAICSKMPQVFYLNDLVKKIKNDYQGDLPLSSIKRLVERLLESYESEEQPIIQSLGSKPYVGAVYRKLYVENEQGELVKSHPILPDYFEIEHIKEVRKIIDDKLDSIENRIHAYQRLSYSFPKTEDWSDAKLTRLLTQKAFLSEDLDVIDELLSDTQHLENECDS
ncbi:hypothetical protein [Vibrio cyclitrophicus]|uniref:hypothetical protein n=1 Tax=Vibrio cyclitrophicus TaxID=47951 RepID=UPI0002F9D34F|nr:hypothetical protein [Vibrio cyclitrophicus]OEF33570.1 hypothetical protein OA9_18200 [Vibrio cyclitrophicus 1F97]OEF39059.1 hypothetical protein OAC_02205 [Vibrio cyclitrophicus 1F273]OEF75338.1 hypothetical protein OA5_06140 [Vibrio cyclitrophicus 1F111]PMH32119.1 hypothetical protein BCU72_16965 [Vibrio cyclitrophicus]